MGESVCERCAYLVTTGAGPVVDFLLKAVVYASDKEGMMACVSCESVCVCVGRKRVCVREREGRGGMEEKICVCMEICKKKKN